MIKRILWLLTCSLYYLQAQAETQLLRYPDIFQQQVVFSYAGDLWIADINNSEPARRLTSHPGIELFPKFSPDGSQVAFTGQYRGDDQVYVISLAGGEPRQLTYYPTKGPMPTRGGVDHQVYDWTPDGQQVLFRSRRDDFRSGRLYQVAVNGGLPSALPMDRAGSGVFSPDGKQLFYSPLMRDFRSWKRYEGGWAQNLYIYDTVAQKVTQVTDHPRTERDPVWLSNGMYFVSDRDGTLELFQYQTGSAEKQGSSSGLSSTSATIVQLTHHDRGDIKWASGDGKSQIIYEYGAQLALFDTEKGTEKRLSIQVPDDEVLRTAQRFHAEETIEDFSLSPDGKRALFSARGDVFSVPAEHGITRNLTQYTPNQSGLSHNRAARWSPDGRHIAFISDRSGEQQIYVMPAQGGAAQQLSRGLKAHLQQPLWSPDSEQIAFHDHQGGLYVVDLDGDQRTVVVNKMQTPNDYSWSPDSQWLAISQVNESGDSAISLWSRKKQRLYPATEPFFNANQPRFSPDGKHLYYLSEREFAPQVGVFEWNYVVNRARGIFALALNRQSGNPFAPRNDEVMNEKQTDAEERNKKQAAVKVNIELKGLSERVIRVPLEADNIDDLTITDTHIVYSLVSPFLYGRSTGVDEKTLYAFNIDKRKTNMLAEKITGVEVSADGKYALINSDKHYQRLALASDKEKKANKPETVNTKNMISYRAPRDEWPVIFDEVWRRFRNYFYVRNMHGYDWNALREQYRPLVKYVSNREDLNYLLSEMVAELNIGHAYVQSGDKRVTQRSSVSLLGARFKADVDAQRYQVAKIFAGHNAEPKYRSPLTEVGVDVKVGDYILAIDGQDLTTDRNPYDLLTDRGDQPVELLVNSKPARKGARRVLVAPVNDESKLVYLAWVEHNRRYVNEKTAGRLGYLHIPDMSGDGIYEFIKWFYPQLRKQGLIVDVRDNGGGNVSSMILQRLWKKPLAFGYPAYGNQPYTYPYDAFIGPMAALIDETSGSDGDLFPHFFREAQLGPLIGKRTWGGVVGIDDHGPLLDGGATFVPEFALATPEDGWIIEGRGVAPDIEVSNNPLSERDAQLDRAITEVMTTVEKQKPVYPARPPAPVKTF